MHGIRFSESCDEQYLHCRGFARQKGKKVTIDNIIWLLVRTRGDLHHFVNSSTRESGTPFTHERYQVLALFIGKISQLVLREEIEQNLT